MTRPGPKPKTDDERYVRINITLSPALAARLRAMPGGPSAAISRMMQEQDTTDA